jgi:hypothetical protein
MIARKLNFEEVKEILIDPWHVLLVSPLGDSELFICTYGQGEHNIIEKVYVENDVSNTLTELEEAKVIWYDRLFEKHLMHEVIWPHFFDAWREEAYGVQSYESKRKAIELGIVV